MASTKQSADDKVVEPNDDLDPADPAVVHTSVGGKEYLAHPDGRVKFLGAAPEGGPDGSAYAEQAASNEDVRAIVEAAVAKALADRGLSA